MKHFEDFGVLVLTDPTKLEKAVAFTFLPLGFHASYYTIFAAFAERKKDEA